MQLLAALAGPRRALSSLARRIDPETAVAAALVCLLVLALVPMVAISAFDHSYADDWHYGVDAHLALEAGRGVAGAIAAAAAEVADTFFSWQGTYSAIFLMALQPGVWSEELYGVGAVAIMVALVASTFFASSVLVRDVLGGGRSAAVAAASAALLLQTQLMPSPVEGIWWYNAAIYYTFYHALMLAAVGLGIRLLRGGTRVRTYTPVGTALRSLLLVALAFGIAGGNFVTALVAGLLLAAAVVAEVRRGNRRGFLLLPALAVFVAGFAASMAAPGNAIRQETQFAGDALGVVPTLIKSGLAAGEYLVLWTNGFLLLMLALVLPLLVRAARRSTCSFRYPGAALMGSFALFAASFTPTFYSMGYVGPGRVQNIRYDLFVILVLVCATWLAGWWIHRREQGAGAGEASDGAEAAPAESLACAAATPVSLAYGRFAAVVLVVLVLSVTALVLDERHIDDLVSLSAARSLVTGEAVEYDAQIRERIERIEESPDAEVEVPFITTAPKVLFMGDIRDNMDTYINYRFAQWWSKDAITGYHASL